MVLDALLLEVAVNVSEWTFVALPLKGVNNDGAVCCEFYRKPNSGLAVMSPRTYQRMVFPDPGEPSMNRDEWAALGEADRHLMTSICRKIHDPVRGWRR